MQDIKLKEFIGKQVSILVRYGFKKKVDETQSYVGKLISVGQFGVIIERETEDTPTCVVNEFFPWHNIDAIRFRSEK
jgi:hypothetical protein